MNKSLKTIFLFFFLASLSLLFRCSTNEDETNRLIGHWDHFQFEDTCGSLCLDCDGATMQFFANNQFTYLSGDNVETSGSYQLNNGVIIFEINGRQEEYTISFGQNTFTIVSSYQTVNETCNVFQTFIKVN